MSLNGRRLRDIGIAIFVAGGAFATTALAARRLNYERRDNQLQAFHRLDSLRRAGSQLALVYIGSARCSWCNNPALPGYLRTIKDSLELRARRAGLRLTTIGIAVDVFQTEGTDHLRKAGSFDEISAGGSWVNGGAVAYIWNRYGLPASTPQVLVIKRSIVRESGEAVTYRVEAESLLARKVGLRPIESWVNGGVQVPRLVHPD